MNRDDLLEHVRALVEDLTGDLATILWGRLESQLDQALDAARSALASDLEFDLDLEPAPERRREPRPAPTARKQRDPKPANIQTGRSAGLNPAKGTRRRSPTCAICGEVGFLTKTCGKTHNVTTEPAAIVAPTARAARVPAPAPSIVSRPVVAQPDDEEDEPEDPAPIVELDDEDDNDEPSVPPPGPRDRFAKIQASAEARTGALPVPRSTFRI